jgi:antibiotic biosynthesis monooxygenase (ABM) superfamily enzyme
VAKVKPVSYYVSFELFAEPETSVKEIKAEIKMILADYCSYRTKDLILEAADGG